MFYSSYLHIWIFYFILNFKQLSSLSLRFLFLLLFLVTIRGESHSSYLETWSSSKIATEDSLKNSWWSASLAEILNFGSFYSIFLSKSNPMLNYDYSSDAFFCKFSCQSQYYIPDFLSRPHHITYPKKENNPKPTDERLLLH